MNTSSLISLVGDCMCSAQDPAVKKHTYAEAKKISLKTVPESTSEIQKQFYQGKAWPSAEYIILSIKDNEYISNEECLRKWKIFSRKLGGTQFLILEEQPNNWVMYDGKGKKVGDEKYIVQYFSELKAKEVGITSESLPIYQSSSPHQLIYFGAPGTSKSTSIKKRTEGKEQHRVTFHPDTDYASFVGCYKPTKEEGQDEISYEFVAQTFVKSYVSAWEKLYDPTEDNKEVFLIVEEINRGNCAQIFGDLFQLLDRNEDGYSDYTIESDEDLRRYLKKAFENSNINMPAIKLGIKMMLPPNLFIWATMNTSDQSLFPIDSAFKRRWNWKYLPIKNEKKDHTIALSDGSRYDWWSFISTVNARIEKVTESEDKQLGYWFAKPDHDTFINAETIVGKVVFYLWNDVFKDYPRDANSPFTVKQEKGEKKHLKFRDFYTEEGEVNEDVLVEFLKGLGLTEVPAAPHPTPGDSNAPEVEEVIAPTATPSYSFTAEEPQAEVHEDVTPVASAPAAAEDIDEDEPEQIITDPKNFF